MAKITQGIGKKFNPSEASASISLHKIAPKKACVTTTDFKGNTYKFVKVSILSKIRWPENVTIILFMSEKVPWKDSDSHFKRYLESILTIAWIRLRISLGESTRCFRNPFWLSGVWKQKSASGGDENGKGRRKGCYEWVEFYKDVFLKELILQMIS